MRSGTNTIANSNKESGSSQTSGGVESRTQRL
jgi:hypothetical protein